MVTARAINPRELVTDIRSGRSDSDLIHKYRISPIGLRNALEKLMDRGDLTPMDVYSWGLLFNKSAAIEHVRLFARDNVDVKLAVYEAKRPETRGLVTNVSSNGLAVRGLLSRVQEIKVLAIPLKSETVTFKARCKWVEREGVDGTHVAGFEIITVLKGDWDKLRESIRELMSDALAKGEPASAAPHEHREDDASRPGAASDAGIQKYLTHSGIPPTEETTVKQEDQKSPAITLDMIEQRLESGELVDMLTNRHYVAFMINPLNFAAISPGHREEMLQKAREADEKTLKTLEKHSRAFQLALENGTILAEL